jgi:hypothetical protein
MSDADLALATCSRVLNRSYSGLTSAETGTRVGESRQDANLRRYFEEMHDSGATAAFKTGSGSRLAVKTAISGLPDRRPNSRSFVLVFGWRDRIEPQFRANVLSELNNITEGVFLYCRKPSVTQFVAGLESREMLEDYIKLRERS